MKVVVYVHHMEIGGSQLNALELARETAARGHDVVVLAPPGGAMWDVARRFGLDMVTLPTHLVWPSPKNMAHAVSAVRRLRADVVHAYEWGPAIDVALGPHMLLGTPAVVTTLSMYVSGYIPRHLPLIVGTRRLEQEAATIYRNVRLMEPPVDTTTNFPRSAGGTAVRARWGFRPDDVVLAVVCRLTDDLDKTAGVLEAMALVERGGWSSALCLLVVGDGPRSDDVAARAEAINAAVGRRAVVVAGALDDPRPAYDAADVVLGMGSSALKGMAFGKPVVVQGERGFWRRLDEESLPRFLEQGWYGSDGRGVAALADALEPLVRRPGLRATLGTFGQRLVADRFSLAASAGQLEQIYRDAAVDGRRSALSLGRTAAVVVRDTVRGRLRERRPRG
ncbi:glycosyltransferase involved in cell wall biosynthesis [Promicromonospora sp. AC04]|uniref:glycosyltransferase family 4 protein n=1 Tax=Promicromonospora sp. AC04 TaxID=2135723 RepID=UPI000D36B29A|nr:glycosyltransferase family 4 protein [Promicromonospora sp. AC04]PUB29939.1 glycosyltransferase involved in cell wall biosynthesis [Promicromonospora sp. AC04]